MFDMTDPESPFYIPSGESYNVGQGYGTGDTYINLSTLRLYSSTPGEWRKVWIPSTSATAGTPAVPPTKTTVQYLTKAGWNTSARSIEQLVPGEYFRFNVMTGVSGALLGIGPFGLDGQGISRFTHAIVCDRAGVHIHENNAQVASLKNRQYSSSLLRIYRHTDGHIVFVSTTGQETIVYTSTVHYSVQVPLFVYGVLYSSGDQILSAEFNAGEVSYGAA